MDFDGTSLYPSAMWDKKSVYRKIESGFAFKLHMNDVYVEVFINQAFIEDSNESAILKIKDSHPLDLIFQHLPVKEKVGNVEINRMRNGYFVDVLTSVDFHEIVGIGGKVIKFF